MKLVSPGLIAAKRLETGGRIVHAFLHIYPYVAAGPALTHAWCRRSKTIPIGTWMLGDGLCLLVCILLYTLHYPYNMLCTSYTRYWCIKVFKK